MTQPIKYDIYDTLLGKEWRGVNLRAWCIYKWCNYRGVVSACKRGRLYKGRYRITIQRPPTAIINTNHSNERITL